MKEFKGTKGEWKILPTSEYRKWVNVTSEKGVIARVFYGEAPPVVYKEEAEANAKLIAAAPDLLEALQEILEAVDNSVWNHPSLEKGKKAIEKSIKLIKKKNKNNEKN